MEQARAKQEWDFCQAVACAGAHVTGAKPMSVVTSPQQWSDAVRIALQMPPRLVNAAAVLSVSVEMEVLQGRIGVLILDSNQNRLSPDVERSSLEGKTAFAFRFCKPGERAWLVIRNNSPDGKPSRCIVNAINTTVLEPGENGRKDAVLGMEAAAGDAVRHATGGSRVFKILRKKWVEVPFGELGRRNTSDLLTLSDDRLRSVWEEALRDASAGGAYSVRGWYHDLYADVLRYKNVLDVGSGLGFDGITFARCGAKLTFLDIVESNLEVVARLCRLFDVEARFVYESDLSSLHQLTGEFDVIWCQGSMMYTPFDFARIEAAALLEHLPPGGRWVELAYPPERWEREGRLPFATWGEQTDGVGTPWLEWYDLDRLLRRLQPARFDVILSFNFHNDDFNWFDLVRRA
jgi:2-polyprenyl-3-methyl-5-hydroxy-6-metoxy-1,4-benzoquinol methylase